MKGTALYFLGTILLLTFSCSEINNRSFASIRNSAKGEQIATFAGGCFWALEEAMSELRGVTDVISGYSGGKIANPNYEMVCSRTTGHAESVQIYYNPELISYATLVEAFFYAHDPTTLNRQGPDIGDDYRSAVFYRSDAERAVLENVIRKVTRSAHYNNTIVTELVPFKVIYPAETYHQDYFRNHPRDYYIRNVSVPKVMKMRKAMPDKLKPEFIANNI